MSLRWPVRTSHVWGLPKTLRTLNEGLKLIEGLDGDMRLKGHWRAAATELHHAHDTGNVKDIETATQAIERAIHVEGWDREAPRRRWNRRGGGLLV